MEKIESKLIESESECARLSDIVLTEIPQLKEELTVRSILLCSITKTSVSVCLCLCVAVCVSNFLAEGCR